MPISLAARIAARQAELEEAGPVEFTEAQQLQIKAGENHLQVMIQTHMRLVEMFATARAERQSRSDCAIRPTVRPRGRSSRRQHAIARSSSRAGDGGDDGGGEPDAGSIALDIARRVEVRPEHLIVCYRCRAFSFAIDGYQREQVPLIGWQEPRLCPGCSGVVR